jgi:hypothetical protein
MSEALIDSHAESVLARFDAVVDELLALPVDSLAAEDLLAFWQRLETGSRRLAVADHALISQVQSLRLDFTHGATSLVAFTRQALRISAREAKARVCAAQAAGPRVGLTGQPLPPVYERVAAAQAAGDISPAHARIVVQTLDALPDPVAAELGHTIEALLVTQARRLDPDILAHHAHDLAHALDQDGMLHDAAARDRRRHLSLSLRTDGSAHLDAELTAEATEHLRTLLDTLARPKPAVEGSQDPRSAGQRRHDALLDALKMLERSAQLPDAGGLTTTVILTADATDWAKSTGTVTTGHGVTLATETAKTWVDGETRVLGLALDRFKAVQAYTNCSRVFTEHQRLQLIARDKGCSFPGCDAPPLQTQSHHLTEHGAGGPTSINNGCLLCAYHHRHFQRMGWQGVMINNIPHWIPPHWIDPQRRPQRNWMHDRATSGNPRSEPSRV